MGFLPLEARGQKKKLFWSWTNNFSNLETKTVQNFLILGYDIPSNCFVPI